MQNSNQNSTVRSRSMQPRRGVWQQDLAVVGATVVCALVAWLPARLAGMDLTVRDGGEGHHVTGPAVAVAAATAAVVALCGLRILERLTTHALSWWILLGLLVLAGSAFLGPLGATSTAGAGTLLALHAVVAAVILIGGWRAHRRVGPTKTRMSKERDQVRETTR